MTEPAQRRSRPPETLADVARFRPGDPPQLVQAALACPICLRGEGVRCEAALDGYDPSIRCLCPSCQARWRVYVTLEQALRLSLMRLDLV
ncbi:MAG TPA: hypothetical protein VKV27_04780 [Solirubrobacteraceae bacterium]|nr:hypothetical protein [Solirubrobacteraceae bacterium]